jgi:hypothetical protein
VIITVNNNTQNAQVRTRESSDSRGNKQIELIIEEVVRGGISSGRFDQTMNRSFGLNRAGRV